jgi:hypothetical protein
MLSNGCVMIGRGGSEEVAGKNRRSLGVRVVAGLIFVFATLGMSVAYVLISTQK